MKHHRKIKLLLGHIQYLAYTVCYFSRLIQGSLAVYISQLQLHTVTFFSNSGKLDKMCASCHKPTHMDRLYWCDHPAPLLDQDKPWIETGSKLHKTRFTGMGQAFYEQFTIHQKFQVRGSHSV